MARRTTMKTSAKRSASEPKGKRKPSTNTTKVEQSAGKIGRSQSAVTKKRSAKTAAVRKTARKKEGSAKASGTSSPSPAASQDPIPLLDQTPLPKTHLKAKELRGFRELLLHKRAELAGDVQGLRQEALSEKGQGHWERSTMPIHMADLGSDNWEQEFTLGLLANEQALVREIDEALSRIENKTYGVCLETHKEISQARLRAKPWAKYCIEYARAREEGRAV